MTLLWILAIFLTLGAEAHALFDMAEVVMHHAEHIVRNELMVADLFIDRS